MAWRTIGVDDTMHPTSFLTSLNALEVTIRRV